MPNDAAPALSEDVRSRIMEAADPSKRRLVVRVRPPASGIEEWVRLGAAEIAVATADERAATTVSPFVALEPGDVIIAADDGSRVLAAGVVVESPNELNDTARRYRARVDWWTDGLPRVVWADPRWQFTEICEVPRSFLISMQASRVRVIREEVPFDKIREGIAAAGMRLPDEVVRRYHSALRSRGFVILTGISGTGKTWLAETYARVTGAQHLVVPVAPNWTSNEDLLGYLNPLDDIFHATAFTEFLERAAREHREAREEGRAPADYHLVLDEMNLARVEYYFAKFLSTMEIRSRSDSGEAVLDLAPGRTVLLPPNLKVVGTVNIDETTHGFADKVYDRAQLVELGSPRSALRDHLRDVPHADLLMRVWDAVSDVAPFAFRVLDDVRAYIAISVDVGASWEEALDDQVLQKILPKVKGNDGRVGKALERLSEVCGQTLPRSAARAQAMLRDYRDHGFASFF